MSPDDAVQESGALHRVEIVEEHPVPITEERADELQSEHPLFRSQVGTLHPDQLHSEYKETLAQNHTWRVFRTPIQRGYVYVWNHQMGYGLRVDDSEGEFRSLVHVMMQAAEVVA